MAVEAFTRTLRMELAPWGIQVCCIEPGGVRTPMTHNAGDNMRKNWESMPQHVRDRYEDVLIKTNEKLAEQLKSANPPELIADGIIKALKAKRLDIRYPVGKEVAFLPMTQKFTTEEIFENILLLQFGIKRNSEV